MASSQRLLSDYQRLPYDFRYRLEMGRVQAHSEE
jgi:hypothetical protein